MTAKWKFGRLFVSACSQIVMLCSESYMTFCNGGGIPVVKQDTVIDAASVLSDRHIQISDGLDGPTTVRVVAGGTIRSFDVGDNSELIIDGGEATQMPSAVTGNARVTMRSGRMGCFQFVQCQVAEFDYDIQAYGNSVLSFYGGTFEGNIRIHDSVIVHFFGSNLALRRQFGLVTIDGTLLDGGPVRTYFNLLPDMDIESHVILHNVPEPLVTASAVGLTLMIQIHRIRRKSTDNLILERILIRRGRLAHPGNLGWANFSLSGHFVAVVPEPSAACYVMGSLMGLAAIRRRPSESVARWAAYFLCLNGSDEASTETNWRNSMISYRHDSIVQCAQRRKQDVRGLSWHAKPRPSSRLSLRLPKLPSRKKKQACHPQFDIYLSFLPTVVVCCAFALNLG